MDDEYTDFIINDDAFDEEMTFIDLILTCLTWMIVVQLAVLVMGLIIDAMVL